MNVKHSVEYHQDDTYPRWEQSLVGCSTTLDDTREEVEPSKLIESRLTSAKSQIKLKLETQRDSLSEEKKLISSRISEFRLNVCTPNVVINTGINEPRVRFSQL